MRKIVVHTFRIADSDDHEIYSAAPLYDWEHSEVGLWVKEHAIGPIEVSQGALEYDFLGYTFKIIAKLSDADITFFNLKYGKFI